jgi:hypothetical protein
MLKNKKARGETLGAIGRLVLAGISLAVVGAILYNIFGPAISGQKDYSESFEEFVEEINSLEPEEASLGLNKKSAVVGFSRGPESYECKNCYFDSSSAGGSLTFSMHSIRVDKSTSTECSGKACVCFCDKGFILKTEDIETSTIGLIPLFHFKQIGQCRKDIVCKALNDELDIVHKTIIKENDGVEWKNGFLFLRGVEGINIPDREILLLFVQREGNEIGVCNGDMMEYNKEILGIDGCINKDWIP